MSFSTDSNQTRAVIVELLSQLGSSREAREYLRRFSSLESVKFAVIKVGGQVLKDEINELASALHFLYQAGLYPIVLHGAGPQLDEALEAAGVESQKINGLRVTTPEVMSIARHVIYEQNLKLVDTLEKMGTRARSVQHGVFECAETADAQLGLVGEVRRVNLTSIQSAIQSQAIPIVTCLGESSSGQVLNVNADFAVNALIEEIQPFKVIFLTATGGLLNESGAIISGINLVTDYERLSAADWVHSGMRVKLEQIKNILHKLPASASVSITSARNLTKELFTHSGAGTLVKKGERLHLATELAPEDRPALEDLIAACFQRRVSADWLSSIDVEQLIWVESKRGVAVISKGMQGVPYLDKFAVTPEAQGEGLASALWKEIRRLNPRMYWRSKVANPINSWYQRQAEFSWQKDGWVVFGYGLPDFELANCCVEDAVAREEKWEDTGAAKGGQS